MRRYERFLPWLLLLGIVGATFGALQYCASALIK
jgi:hypothetical protein